MGYWVGMGRGWLDADAFATLAFGAGFFDHDECVVVAFGAAVAVARGAFIANQLFADAIAGGAVYDCSTRLGHWGYLLSQNFGIVPQYCVLGWLLTDRLLFRLLCLRQAMPHAFFAVLRRLHGTACQ